jgi:thioredoxin 1
MDSKQFQKTIESGIVLVDFNAPWCAPCKIQEPIIHNVKKKFKDKVSVIFINIDENRTLATDFMVQSIPTLVVFKNGIEEERFIGLQNENTIEEKLNSVIQN